MTGSALPLGVYRGLWLWILTKKNGKQGLQEFKKLCDGHPDIVTRTVKTPTGGQHWYFKHGGCLKTRIDHPADGIDFKADGGYIVAPPTVLKNGDFYSVINDVEPIELPKWLEEIFTTPGSTKPDEKSKLYMTGNNKHSYKIPARIKEGSRNDTLHKVACSLAAKGISDSAVLAAVQVENKNKCHPPLDENEVITIVGSACSFVRQSPPFAQASFGHDTYNPVKQLHPLQSPNPEFISDEEMAEVRAKFRNLMPTFPELPEGFFHDYVEYGKRMSYAVPEFHFGSIITILSTALGRKVVMRSTAHTLYCNINCMIIGQTTISGKSTACDMAVDGFFGIIEQEGVCTKLTKKNSPQSVIQRLAKVPNRLWHYDECAEFFEDVGNKWAAALESIMCSIYDGREVSYGLAEGKAKTDEFKVKDPFLSCLWNTTDGEIERHADWNSFSNGFFPRFMWFWTFNENIPRKNRPITLEDVRIKTDLEKRIQVLRKILGKTHGNNMIVFTPSDIIENWKINNDLAHLAKEHETYRIATGRLTGHAYKMAMLFTLMDPEFQADITNTVVFPHTFTIPEKHAQTALKIVDEYLRPRILHVAELCESNKTKSGQDAIIKILKKHEGVATKAILLRNTRIRSKVMDELLMTLEESGTVTIRSEKSSTKTGMVVMLND